MSAKKLTAQQIRQVLSRMPFNSLVGVRLTRVHADGVTIECTIRPEHLNGSGVVHGGVTATMADSAAGIATNRHCGGTRGLTTVEFKINYFRPVLQGKIFARAFLIRTGSTLVVSRVDLTDSDKNLIGAALVTYMLLGERSPVAAVTPG